MTRPRGHSHLEAQQRYGNLAQPLTLAAMSLGFAVVQLDVTIVNVALNAIGASFSGRVASLQWVVNAYTVSFAAFILSAGALGDRIGAKRVFSAGFAIFTLASLSCAFATSIGMLIASRVGQGIGAAILVPNSLAMLNHTYHDERGRTRAVALWAAGASVALTAGPLIGGALIQVFGWRSIFLVNLPIGAAGLYLTWRFATETPQNRRHALDLGGQTAAFAALGLTAATLIASGARGWLDPWVLGGAALAVLAFVAFVTVERRSTQPMLPLGLFANPGFAATTAAGLLINTAFYGLIFVFSLYFQQVGKLTPWWTGLAFVPMTGACLATNFVAAPLSRRIGPRAVIIAGSVIMTLGCLSMLPLIGAGSYAILFPSFIAAGGGLGLVVPPLTAALLGSVDKSRSGVAAGVLNSSRQTGSVLGVALLGSVLSRAADMDLGMRATFLISAVALAAAVVVTLCGVRKPQSAGKSGH
ncbi:MAG TPA: MFS transporter [Pseudolabrys sp.]|nr:MFS transporter [Pseudolabrys sp.]